MVNGRLKGSNGGLDGGEGVIGVVKGKELGEEVGMAGEEFGAEKMEGMGCRGKKGGRGLGELKTSFFFFFFFLILNFEFFLTPSKKF